MTLITGILVTTLFGYIFFVYNKIASLAKQHRNIIAKIDDTLKKRYDIFTTLINSLKDGMDVEKSNLSEVPMLREKALEAEKEDDEKTRIGMEDKISHIAGGISFIFEQHLDLKADHTAHEHHDALVNIEEELAHLKESANKIVHAYIKSNNGLLPLILTNLFAKQLVVNCETWHINSEALDGREKYKVEMT